jgi:hypothetical protein
MFIFFRLGRLSKESVQVRGFLWSFVTSLFLRWEIVSPTPKPQAGGPPFVGCPRLLIQYIHSYPPKTGGSLLHPQPEDAPCRGDKGPT